MGWSQFHSEFFYSSFSVRDVSLVGVVTITIKVLVQGRTLVGILSLQMRKSRLREVNRLGHLFGFSYNVLSLEGTKIRLWFWYMII